MLSIIMQTLSMAFAGCHYAECCDAGCCGTLKRASVHFYSLQQLTYGGHVSSVKINITYKTKNIIIY